MLECKEKPASIDFSTAIHVFEKCVNTNYLNLEIHELSEQYLQTCLCLEDLIIQKFSSRELIPEIICFSLLGKYQVNTLSTFESYFSHNSNTWALRGIIAAKGDLHVSIVNKNDNWTIHTLLGVNVEFTTKNNAILGSFESGYTPVAFLYFHHNNFEGKREDWNGKIDTILEAYLAKASKALRIQSKCITHDSYQRKIQELISQRIPENQKMIQQCVPPNYREMKSRYLDSIISNKVNPIRAGVTRSTGSSVTPLPRKSGSIPRPAIIEPSNQGKFTKGQFQVPPMATNPIDVSKRINSPPKSNFLPPPGLVKHPSENSGASSRVLLNQAIPSPSGNIRGNPVRVPHTNAFQEFYTTPKLVSSPQIKQNEYYNTSDPVFQQRTPILIPPPLSNFSNSPKPQDRVNENCIQSSYINSNIPPPLLSHVPPLLDSNKEAVKASDSTSPQITNSIPPPLPKSIPSPMNSKTQANSFDNIGISNYFLPAINQSIPPPLNFNTYLADPYNTAIPQDPNTIFGSEKTNPEARHSSEFIQTGKFVLPPSLTNETVMQNYPEEVKNREGNLDVQVNELQEYEDRFIHTHENGYQYWYCKNCNHFNHLLDNFCGLCKQPRFVENAKEEPGKQIQSIEQYQDGSIYTNDLGQSFWYCKLCAKSNYVNEDSCFECKKKRKIDEHWYCYGCQIYNYISFPCSKCGSQGY